jgi:hypothetical protein
MFVQSLRGDPFRVSLTILLASTLCKSSRSVQFTTFLYLQHICVVTNHVIIVNLQLIKNHRYMPYSRQKISLDMCRLHLV